MHNKFSALIGLAGLATAALGTSATQAQVVANWNGLYFGGHIGHASSDTNWNFGNNSFYNTAAGERAGFEGSGVIGGGHLGYNFQTGPWVYGLELSLSAGVLDNSKASPFFPATDSFKNDVNWLFTTTARLGYTISPWMLVYVKGGYASGEVETRLTSTAAGGTSGGSSEWHPGYVLGTGFEFAFTPVIRAGLDYSFISLGSKSHHPDCSPVAVCAGGGGSAILSVDPGDVHVVSARISFLLNYDRWEPVRPLK